MIQTTELLIPFSCGTSLDQMLYPPLKKERKSPGAR